MTYEVTQDYRPGIFERSLPEVLKGYTLVKLNEESYQVVDLQGRHTGIIPVDVFRKISKKQAAAADLMKAIGQQVKEARKARKLTLEEAAAKIKASKVYISRVESGSGNISIPQLQKIVNSMGYELKIKIVRKYEQLQTAPKVSDLL